jgi:hypothetical protein
MRQPQVGPREFQPNVAIQTPSPDSHKTYALQRPFDQMRILIANIE